MVAIILIVDHRSFRCESPKVDWFLIRNLLIGHYESKRGGMEGEGEVEVVK